MTILLVGLEAQAPGVLVNNTVVLLRVIRTGHYLGKKPFKKSLPRLIKRKFLSSLDPQGLYFLRSDIEALMDMDLNVQRATYENRIPFFEKSEAVYKHRLKEALVRLEQLAAYKPDFQARDELEIYPFKEIEYQKTPEKLRERWEALLKFRILSRSYFRTSPQDAARFAADIAKNGATLQRKALTLEKNIIQDILKHPEGFRGNLAGQFYNALLSSFDPHSAYFTKTDMKQFQASLSTRGYSFGVVFKRELSGETRILRLIPGGPGWKSGILNKGDVILKLALPGKNKPEHDVQDLSSAKLRALFSGKSNKKLKITVRKKNGLIKKTVLYRAKLRLEDNIINSFILKGKTKIGYIYLPSFYTQWESRFAPGCANDVATEILRLKRENIQGLIMDLRGNGGGSLKEALALSGIFINQGPLHIQEQPNRTLKLLKDPNRGRIYSGPLLVMVNGNSASASEFFAAAMQDHNRALIVGSRTFGKGTSQIIGPMRDRRGRLQGFIKFTTDMYYNLNGGTHQQKGVKPHIQLPDMGNVFRTEKSLANSISPGRIRKKVSYTKSTKIDPDDLEDKSEDRVSDDPNFRKIKSLSRKLKKLIKQRDEIPLKLEKFFKQAARFNETFKNYRRQLRRPSSFYQVTGHRAAKNLEKIDAYRKEINDERRKDILGDIYIEESYRIMTDYIPLFKE